MEDKIRQIKPWHLVIFAVVILICDIIDLPSLLIPLFNTHLSIFSIVPKFVVEEKGSLLFMISILYAILIYTNQHLNAADHKEQLESAIEKIQPFQVEKIDEKLDEWLQDNKTSFILFYYPYSFFPGFWVNCELFEKDYLNKLENIQKLDNQFVYFIGPKYSNKNFKNVLEYISDNISDAYSNNLNNKLWKKASIEDFFENSEFDGQAYESIKKLYNEKVRLITTVCKKKHNYFGYSLLNSNHNNYWEGKPDFSFILRMYQDHESPDFEIIINDTFQLAKQLKITCNIDLEILKKPPTYYLNDENLSSLFISTILQSFKDDHDFMNFVEENNLITF